MLSAVCKQEFTSVRILCLGNFRRNLVGLSKNKMLCACRMIIIAVLTCKQMNLHCPSHPSSFFKHLKIPICSHCSTIYNVITLLVPCMHTCKLVISVPVTLVSLHSVTSTWLFNQTCTPAPGQDSGKDVMVVYSGRIHPPFYPTLHPAFESFGCKLKHCSFEVFSTIYCYHAINAIYRPNTYIIMCNNMISSPWHNMLVYVHTVV